MQTNTLWELGPRGTPIGFEPTPVLKAIRAKCPDCFGGTPVRDYLVRNCVLYPFRMGTNPWRAPITEEQRASMPTRQPRGRARSPTGRLRLPAEVARKSYGVATAPKAGLAPDAELDSEGLVNVLRI